MERQWSEQRGPVEKNTPESHWLDLTLNSKEKVELDWTHRQIWNENPWNGTPKEQGKEVTPRTAGEEVSKQKCMGEGSTGEISKEPPSEVEDICQWPMFPRGAKGLKLKKKPVLLSVEQLS